ncbi:MAG: polya polymerase, partial [Geopsychrobacter sp.]|nr:polya polymerase [Geopsychrobacter sp.]
GEAFEPCLVDLLCLFDRLPRRELKRTLVKLEMKVSWQKVLLDESVEARKALAALERSYRRGRPPAASKIYHWLQPLSLETLIFMLARTADEEIRRAISHYVTSLRHQQTALDGHDLTAMGLSPGESYKHILKTLLDARLDGKISTRNEEIALVKNQFLP